MPQTPTIQGGRHPRERGQGVVETIITLPVFLLLSTVILQTALLGVGQILLQYAAFSAARVGAVHGGEVQPMKAAAVAILRSAPACRTFPGPDISLELLPPPGVKTTGKKPSTAPPQSPSPMRVRITWRFPLIVPVAGPLLGGWRGTGTWLHPVFTLQASWGTAGEAP